MRLLSLRSHGQVSPNMIFIVTVFLIAHGLSFVHLCANWIGFRCTRTDVQTVNIFHGKTLASFPLLGTTFVIGCIPTGCGLKFDTEQFARLALPVRLAVFLLGPASLLVLSAAVLRYDAALHHFASGFSQFISGAMHPRTIAIELLTRLEAVFTSSFSTLVGVLAAKISAADLTPIGTCSGGRCVSELFSRYAERRWFTVIQVFNALIWFAILIAWGFACFVYVIRGL